jgi:hypothetical protein
VAARGEAMTPRRTFVVAVAWLATVAGAMLVFVARAGSSYSDSSFSAVLGGLVLGIATNASVGAILTLRRPGNVVGLVLMFGAVLSAITLLTWVSGAAMTTQRGRDDVLAGLLSLIGGLGFFPTLIVFWPLLALLFPTGRLPGRGWRWPVRATFGALAVALAAGVAHPGPIPGTLANNPFGVGAFTGYEAFWTVGLTVAYASLPVSLVLALAAVIVRWRRSRGVERAQLKWFVAANVAVGALLTLGFADGGLDVGLYAGVTPTIFDFLAVASLSLPAVAVGIAILRYNLYDIDRLISRTIAYGAVTGILGAIFVGTILALQGLLAPFTKEQTIPVAASTLAVFALFQPVRGKVQSAVDRRFDRARYDADQTVRTFAERLRDDLDLGTVSTEIVRTASATVRPTSASVWLRGSSR